jgi:pyruvate formate lyase activating enzyme
MVPCQSCGKMPAAKAVDFCPDCLRAPSKQETLVSGHAEARKRFRLPPFPPKTDGGIPCPLCINECRLGLEERGYCGLRKNENGRLKALFPKNAALAHMYFDPLPTNCCAAWFCEGSHENGYNLAVFFYGCNFDCLFCQNSSHKYLDEAPVLTEAKIINAALSPEVRCVCFFGGSPEPQLPWALRVSRKILQESGNKKHICWEWNGCGHPDLAKRAARLSAESGGTVKFDLKAFHPNIVRALCGTNLDRAFQNFAAIAKDYPRGDVLTATTLLVPYYVDKIEVEEIARFISRQNKDIPYSLLVFHPDFLMSDLPVTPRMQARECVEAARRQLSRVNLGNTHLLEPGGLWA